MGSVRAGLRQRLLASLPTPASGEMTFGFKSDGKLYKKDSNSVETLIEGGGGGSSITLGAAFHSNADFEVLTSDQSKPSNWSDFWGNGTRSMATDATTSVFGSRSAKITVAANAQLPVQAADASPCVGGQIVNIGFWAKGAGGQVTAGMHTAPAGIDPNFFNAGTVQTLATAVTTTAVWTKYTASLRVPDNHTSIRIGLTVNGVNNGAAVVNLDGTESSLSGGNAGPTDLCRMTEGASNIPANTWTGWTGGTISTRGGNVTGAPGGTITVAVSGWYRVTTNIQFNSGIAARNIMRVVIGGNPDANVLISTEGYGGSAAIPALSGADIVYLAAGSQIRQFFYCTSATSAQEKHLTIEACDPSGSAAIQAIADTGWIDLPMSNGWRAYAAGYDSPQYRKIGNTVHIKGFLAGGTTTVGTVVATLPGGFRPIDISHIVTTDANGAAARLNIYPDGTIRVNSGWSNVWTTLGYISFPVDAVASGIMPADSGWKEMAFAFGFGHFESSGYNGTGWQAGRYKKVGDRVFVEGLVQRLSGSGTTICYLPAGFRPPRSLIFPTQNNGGFSRMDVTASDGGIAITAGTAVTTGGYISINCEFSTA